MYSIMKDMAYILLICFQLFIYTSKISIFIYNIYYKSTLILIENVYKLKKVHNILDIKKHYFGKATLRENEMKGLIAPEKFEEK